MVTVQLVPDVPVHAPPQVTLVAPCRFAIMVTELFHVKLPVQPEVVHPLMPFGLV